MRRPGGMGGLLQLCQGGSCICDATEEKVLYCYGEVGAQI
jgi:hypothetical protein